MYFHIIHVFYDACTVYKRKLFGHFLFSALQENLDSFQNDGAPENLNL